MADVEREIRFKTGDIVKPKIVETRVSELLMSLYGLTVKEVMELLAQDSCVFNIICDSNAPINNVYINKIPNTLSSYTLEVSNAIRLSSDNLVKAEFNLLLFLEENKIITTLPVKQKTGEYFSKEKFIIGKYTKKEDETGGAGEDQEEEGEYVVRLMLNAEGTLLKNVPIIDNDFLKNIGRFTGQLDKLLKSFKNSAYISCSSLLQSPWYLENFVHVKDFIPHISSKNQKELAFDVMAVFENTVLPIRRNLAKSIVHTNISENNLIVNVEEKKVVGILDFGHSRKTFTIFNLAKLISNILLIIEDFKDAKQIIEGYQEYIQLEDAERKILKLCVCASLIQECTMMNYSRKINKVKEMTKKENKQWMVVLKLWRLSNIDNWWGL